MQLSYFQLASGSVECSTILPEASQEYINRWIKSQLQNLQRSVPVHCTFLVAFGRRTISLNARSTAWKNRKPAAPTKRTEQENFKTEKNSNIKLLAVKQKR